MHQPQITLNTIKLLLIVALISIDTFAIAQKPPAIKVDVTSGSKLFYFMAPINFKNKPGIVNSHLVIDETGHTVYYRMFPGLNNIGGIRVQQSGNITHTYKGVFLRIDSLLNTDTLQVKNGIFQDTHDIIELPNGNILFLGFEYDTVDLSGYNMFNGNNTPGSSNAILKTGIIQELDKNNNVVFQWHCKDHYDFDDVDEKWLNNPANVDWTHLNAVEKDANGDYYISVRHFNEITKISGNTGQIIWRLGGKKNQFNFTNDSEMFVAQHDCRILPNGNLSLFDNGGNGNPVHPAAGKEYKLDEINKTANLVWSHKESNNFFSRAMGNMQRLANGNTLINYGVPDYGTILFNIIDPLGNKLFQASSPDTLPNYRAFAYEKLPKQFTQPKIECSKQGNDYYLTAEAGFSEYIWSTGTTSNSIKIDSIGTYWVYVKLKNDGFLSSIKLVVDNLQNPCLSTNIKTLSSKKVVEIYPNPVKSIINFSGEIDAGSEYKIFDVLGAVVVEGVIEQNKSANVNHLKPGIYFLSISGNYFRIMKE